MPGTILGVSGKMGSHHQHGGDGGGDGGRVKNEVANLRVR